MSSNDKTDLAYRHNIILGEQFIKALLAADIIRVEDNVSRVVIDIRADRVLTLYVERFGDERLLSVVPDLEGVGITWAPK